MSDISKYLGNKILRWMAGASMPSPPTIYVGLFNGDPKTSGVEVSETLTYTGRQLLSLATPADDGETNQAVSDAAVDFGNAEGAATVSHIGFFDDPTDGNLLWSRELPGGPFAITIGLPVSFNIGGIIFNCGS
jgi:hypothetical protein